MKIQWRLIGPFNRMWDAHKSMFPDDSTPCSFGVHGIPTLDDEETLCAEAEVFLSQDVSAEDATQFMRYAALVADVAELSVVIDTSEVHCAVHMPTSKADVLRIREDKIASAMKERMRTAIRILDGD